MTDEPRVVKPMRAARTLKLVELTRFATQAIQEKIDNLQAPVDALTAENQSLRMRLYEVTDAQDIIARAALGLAGWLQNMREDVERLEGAFDMADDPIANLDHESRRDLERTATKCREFWQHIIEQLAEPVDVE